MKLLGVMVLLAACASVPASTPRHPSPATPAPVLLPSPSATPSVAPTPTLNPGADLSFSPLSFSTNTCWTDVQDADGHLLHGGIVTFKLTAHNTGSRASIPLWLRIDPTDYLLSSPIAIKGSLGKGLILDGQSVAFGGTTVPAHGQTALHWQVFFEAPYAVHYQTSLRYSDPRGEAGMSWNDTYTTINVC